MPALAAIVDRVVAEDQERRRRSAGAIRAALVVEHRRGGCSRSRATDAVVAPPVRRWHRSATAEDGPDPVDGPDPDHGSIRIAVAAGA